VSIQLAFIHFTNFFKLLFSVVMVMIINFKITYPKFRITVSVSRDTLEVVRVLSEPAPGSRDLHFSTRFPQNSLGQFMACLWKQHLSYWRSPEYNLTRFIFMIVCAIIFGAVFWQKGNEM